MQDYEARLTELKDRYVAVRPRSRCLMEKASMHLPGGNTRSVLHFDPFPIVMNKGWEDRLQDVDGHDYLDCAGEFSAGLYGHSDQVILGAIRSALGNGLVLGAPNRYEAELAGLIAHRFNSIEQVRFCNSGTEANLLALMTACIVTGRKKVLVFEGAYHGGVLSFPIAGNPMNVPFQVETVAYNDEATFTSVMASVGDQIAAVIVEPILGAAGNMRGSQSFLERLREETRTAGALLVFDEVKTSRLGNGGMQGLTRITPDLTTLGKYVGGGLSFGAFGGPSEIMKRFDPARNDALKHAGTFNNNPVSLAAGIAGLKYVFTAARADDFFRVSEEFRQSLAERLSKSSLPIQVTGLGSILSLHYGENPPRSASEVAPRTAMLRALIHLRCLDEGIYLSPRGDIFLSLPMARETLLDLAIKLTDIASKEIDFV